MSSVKFAYRHLPVSARVGDGAYTYTLIAENSSSVLRYEIFANSFEDAVYKVQFVTKYPVTGFIVQDRTTWQIFLSQDMGFRYFLYID